MKLFDAFIILSMFLLSAGILSAQDCPDFTQNNLLRITENCQAGIVECLPIDYEFSEEYEYTLNGSPYNGSIMACGVGNEAAYDVLGIASYPINIDSWEVDGLVFSNISVGSPGALADTMTILSGANWIFDEVSFKIETTEAPDSLGWLVLSEINTGLIAEILPEYSSAGASTAFEFPIGNHEFIVYNFVEDCADTLLIDVVCQQITDTLSFTIEIGEVESVVFDPTNLGPVSSFINECTAQSGTAVAFTIDQTAYSLEYFGIDEGTEQACIVACGNNGICDTTYVFVTVVNTICTDPVIANIIVINQDCDEPGSIQLFMEDPNQDYQFIWDNGIPDTDYATDLSAGTYNVTITYADSTQQSCFITESFTVEFLDSLENYSYSISPSCNNDGVVVFDNFGLTYTWEDGFQGQTRFDVLPGTYNITVSSNNCEEVATIVMTESGIDVFASIANVCDSLGSIYLDVTGFFPPYTYQWSDGVFTKDRPSVNVGIYSVTVTNSDGCTVENTYEIVDDCPSTGCTDPVIASVEVINPSCAEPGSIAIQLEDASVPYDFEWSHNGMNSGVQIDLWAADFAVTITNTNPTTGEVCSTTAEFTLVDDDTLDYNLVSLTEATCIEPGGAEFSNNNLVYNWSDGGQGRVRNDLPPGGYSITVSSANGSCQSITNLTILEESFMLNATVNNVCDSLGAIYLMVTGNFSPFTYQWSNGAITRDQEDVDVGTYGVTITDSQGCTLSEFFEIVDDCPGTGCEDPIISAAEIQNPDCDSPGSIFLEVENFNSNTTFAWSHNGDDSNIQTELPAGNYDVTITNFDPATGSSCFVTAGFDLVLEDSLGFFLMNSTPADCGPSGTAEYSDPTLIYNWSDGGQGHIRTDLFPGVYMITVTSPTETCEVVTFLDIPEISTISYNPVVANVCDTLGSIYLFNPNGSYTYEWSNGTITPDQPAVDVGIYSVTVTNDQGCTVFESFEIVDDCPSTGDLTFTFVPEDVDILCGESAPIINPVAESECPGDIEYTFSETSVPNCGNTNIITREWVATDDCGNTASAQQTIFEEDLEAPEIITVGDITIDLFNGDSLPNPFSLATAEDDCSGLLDLNFTKEENITEDGYEVAYTWTAIDECGNLTTEFHTVDVTGGMIWPGDTDSNKVVNNFDVFNIGFAYGETGPARMMPTLDFLPQYAAPWSANGLDDVNFRHADTDGNGIVDEQDILAVNLNYDLVHNLQEAGDTRESFDIDFVYETVTADNWVHVAIMLGNTAEPIDDFYGAGFIIEYDQNMVVANTAHVDFSESWTGTFFDDFIALQKDFHDEGRLDVGLVRTNQQGINGSGKIGSFRFQLPEGVEFSPFTLTAREGEGVRADKSPYELETVEVIVTNVKEFLPLSAIQAFPNPVKTELNLTIPTEFEVTGIQLFGTNGQMVQQYTNATRTLEVSALPAGLYYLRVLTTEGTWTDKVSIMK